MTATERPMSQLIRPAADPLNRAMRRAILKLGVDSVELGYSYGSSTWYARGYRKRPEQNAVIAELGRLGQDSATLAEINAIRDRLAATPIATGSGYTALEAVTQLKPAGQRRIPA